MSFRFWLLPLALFCLVSVHAQLNIKVGYEFIKPNLASYNKALADFNTVQGSNLVDAFGNSRFMNGLSLGARYKVSKYIGFEGTWKYAQGNNSEAKYDNAGATLTEKWRSKLNSYSIGMTSYTGPVGIGVSLDRNNLKYDQNNVKADKYFAIQNNIFNSATIYAEIAAEGNSSSFALRPFYTLPFQKYSVPSVRTALGLPASSTANDGSFWGISLIIYNGPQ